MYWFAPLLYAFSHDCDPFSAFSDTLGSIRKEHIGLLNEEGRVSTRQTLLYKKVILEYCPSLLQIMANRSLYVFAEPFLILSSIRY